MIHGLALSQMFPSKSAKWIFYLSAITSFCNICNTELCSFLAVLLWVVNKNFPCLQCKLMPLPNVRKKLCQCHMSNHHFSKQNQTSDVLCWSHDVPTLASKKQSAAPTWVRAKWNMAAIWKGPVGSSALCMWGMVSTALLHACSLSLCSFLLSLSVPCLSLCLFHSSMFWWRSMCLSKV